MLTRSHYIALGLVLALTLTIIFLPAKSATRLKIAVGSVFLPLFGLAGSTHQLADKTSEALTTRSELARQNETLLKENERLSVLSQQNESLVRENNHLRDELKWRALQKSWDLKFANVIARDPANWWRTVQIDLGSRDGMRTNMPVLSADGLVGRILSVSLATSQVALLGDPSCKVSAVVENPGRDMGILGVSGPLESALVTMTYLPKEANIKPGQNVFTSGLGGVFPKGIFIGKIVDSRPVEFGLYLEARVKLAANLSGLEEVWVKMQ